MGSAENLIAIDKDQGFSEETPQNPPLQKPPVMGPRPALQSIENLQNSRQRYDY